MTNKKLNYPAIAKEAAILTGAVAIIAAAVYFFLVPSHTSVSSISGLGIVLSNFVPLPLSAITMALNTVLLIIGFFHLRQGVGRKNRVYQRDAAGVSEAFRAPVPGFRFPDRQSGTGCAVLYSGGQRGSEHPVQPQRILRRTGYRGKDHE